MPTLSRIPMAIIWLALLGLVVLIAGKYVARVAARAGSAASSVTK